MQATHTANLDIPELPQAATTAHVFPQLTNTLISISQLCDHGCDATFTAQDVKITHNDDTLINGKRDDETGLWTLVTKKRQPKQHGANNVHQLESKGNLVKFLHQCCFSPTTTTWLQAVKAGYFATWPGLTCELIQKHLPKSEATTKGHLRQQFQNARSTKPSAIAASPDTQVAATARTNNVFIEVFNPTGQVYTDQTGRFPAISSKGNKYLMILYDYDSNAILAEPMKSRHEQEMIRAYAKMHDYLTERGLKPVLQKLDNEAPKGLKKYMAQHNVTYQLVPPHVHRRNAAERAIGTFKDHFIAGLSTTDKRFPMHLWCQLIPQATITLNLLRASRLNPRLSANEQLNGTFDFNRTPLAPPGTKVIVHVKPLVRQTWAPHGLDGWYIGPAMEHYRCFDTYISSTAHTRVSDTVEFFPAQAVMPQTSSADRATQAAHDLVEALQNPAPATPYLTVRNTHLAALQQLAEIFSKVTKTATPARVPTAEAPPLQLALPGEPPRVVATAAPEVPATTVQATRPVSPPRAVIMQEQAPTVQQEQ